MKTNAVKIHFDRITAKDEEYGRRSAEGLGIEVGVRPTADTVGAS